ncbi:MAG: hypothetical protein E7L15_17585 [Citrobacter portucalensis]|nr:hypothetical protein [Citrobacter portucalensis]
MKWIMLMTGVAALAIAFCKQDDTAAIASAIFICAAAIIVKIEEAK